MNIKESVNSISIEQALAGDVHFIVPNSRLSRILKQRLGQWSAGGSCVFTPPKVSLLKNWVEQTVEEALLSGQLSPANLPLPMLSASEERLLWESAVESVSCDALLDTEQAASIAMETHHLLQTGCLDIPENIYEVEWQNFLTWQKAFVELCNKHKRCNQWSYYKNVLDVALPKIDVKACLVLIGFIEFTAIDEHALNILRNKGVEIAIAKLPIEESTQQLYPCSSLDDEFLQALSWAKQSIEQNPNGIYALLVSNLDQHRYTLDSLSRQIFHPDELLPSGDEVVYSYNLALGKPMVEFAVVQTALDLLKLLDPARPIEYEVWSRLFLSIYCFADKDQSLQRAQIDAWLRQHNKPYLSVKEVVALLSDEKSIKSPESLLAIITELANNEVPKKLSAEAIEQHLQFCGWPGEPLLSSEQKTVNAFWRHLSELEAIQPLMGEGADKALYWLQRELREAIHQNVGSDNAPLQIMGMLDAVGRQFDGVWIVNLTDENWPVAPKPNPFIPWQYQEHLPHGNSLREFLYAEKVTEQLFSLARVVNCSYSKVIDERDANPSPFIEHLPHGEPITPAVIGITPYITKTYQVDNVYNQPWLNWVDDVVGLPIKDAASVKGGANLFKQQAVSPCLGYLSRSVLPCVDEVVEPEDELSSLDKGNLLHWTLEFFYQEYSTLALLAQLDDAQLKRTVSVFIKQAIDKLASKGKVLGKKESRLETQRLLDVIIPWLNQEKSRENFTVVAREKSLTFTFNGFAIRGQIDRIDQLDNQQHIIMDYKTGGSVSTKNWYEPRLLDPQMPLYLIGSDVSEVAGILLVQLNNNEQKALGVIDESNYGFSAKTVAVMAEGQKNTVVGTYGDWQTLRTHWQSQLNILADELTEGYGARVIYDDTSAQWSDAYPLLRYAEILQQQQSLLLSAKENSHE